MHFCLGTKGEEELHDLNMPNCTWVLQRFCSQPTSGMGASFSSSSQAANSSLPQDPITLGEGGVQGAAQELRAFCREALYECITLEKPGSLQSYLLLYSLMQGILGGGHPAGTVPLALLQSTTAEACGKLMTLVLART